MTGGFWYGWQQRVHGTTIPTLHEKCESTGRIDNLRRAAGLVDKPFQGRYYNDSDVFKYLEACAWDSLADDDGRTVRQRQDEVIGLIKAGQQPDGYCNSYFVFERAAERWTNLPKQHELYCLGHLIQAGIADARMTGRTQLLDVVRAAADHAASIFGPPETGKRPCACGHPELEMALVELYRFTGDRRYLTLAQHMIDVRGNGQAVAGGGSHVLDDIPYRQIDRMVGHAVCATYLGCGAADVYAETGDPALREAMLKQWTNMACCQSHASNGIGLVYEAFGRDYELPTEKAYAESCAAIARAMWDWRLLLITGDVKFADDLEWTLYNAIVGGLSLDGSLFFYQHPLSDNGKGRRKEWFETACCPPNLARLVAQVSGYFYTTSPEGVEVQLYGASDASITLQDGRRVRIIQETNYPWDGAIDLRIVEADIGDPWTVSLRIPGWCAGEATVSVNGDRESAGAPKSYTRLRRQWKSGDLVRVHLPMPARRMEAHPYAAEMNHRVALSRGPLLYCVEAIDHDVDVRDLILPDTAALEAEWKEDHLGGVILLRAAASGSVVNELSLYRPMPRTPATTKPTSLTAVPFFARANREPGRLQVWLRRGIGG